MQTTVRAALTCAESWSTWIFDTWRYVRVEGLAQCTERIARPLAILIEVRTTPAHSQSFRASVSNHLMALRNWDVTHPVRERAATLQEQDTQSRAKRVVWRDGIDAITYIGDGCRCGQSESHTPEAAFFPASELSNLFFRWAERLSIEDEKLTLGLIGQVQQPAPIPASTLDKSGTRAVESDRGRRTEVVLWEGAEHNEYNIRLARTRTAYLEAHGDVAAALEALNASGNQVSRSTFYNHINALDKAISGWKESVQLSNRTGNLDGTEIVGTRKKSRGKVR